MAQHKEDIKDTRLSTVSSGYFSRLCVTNSRVKF